MTECPTPETKPDTDAGDADSYRCFLQRKVDAARLSRYKEPGLSNEDIETEFAGRRAKAAEWKMGEL
jgi:hypothetical protein